MPELKERFDRLGGELDRIAAPDLWLDATNRQPSSTSVHALAPSRRLGIVLAALLIAVAGVGWGFFALVRTPVPQRPLTPPTGPLGTRYGISFEEPSGWHSRIGYVAGSTGPLLQIANFRLLGPDQNLYAAALARGGISIQLQEIVKCECPGFTKLPAPLRLTASDLVGAGAGTAAATEEVNDRYFDVIAAFGAGANVSSAQLRQANQILRRVQVQPGIIPIPQPATDLQPVRFRTIPEWFQTSMPAAGEVLPITWVSNVGIDPADLRFVARDRTLAAWPDATLRSMPSGGIVFAVSNDSQFAGLGSNPNYQPMTLPLNLSDADRETRWEGQSAPNVPLYLFRANIDGVQMTLRIFFGTQHPSDAQFLEAQEMLRTLQPIRSN